MNSYSKDIFSRFFTRPNASKFSIEHDRSGTWYRCSKDRTACCTVYNDLCILFLIHGWLFFWLLFWLVVNLRTSLNVLRGRESICKIQIRTSKVLQNSHFSIQFFSTQISWFLRSKPKFSKKSPSSSVNTDKSSGPSRRPKRLGHRFGHGSGHACPPNSAQSERN